MALSVDVSLGWSLGDVPPRLVQKERTGTGFTLGLCILLVNGDWGIRKPANKRIVAAQFIEALTVSLPTPALRGMEMCLFLLL